MVELWVDVKGYEGMYKISNTGFVKSVNRKRLVCGGGFRLVKSRILKNSINNTGYHRVNLSNDSKIKSFLVHRLVAIHFLNNPENKRTVNHIDGVKTNNNIENLEWSTDKENINHSYKILNNKHGRRMIKDNTTNEVFRTLKDVVDSSKYSKSHLSAMLNGHYKNKSKYTYIE